MISPQTVLNKLFVLLVAIVIIVSVITVAVGIVIPYVLISYVFYIINDQGHDDFSKYMEKQNKQHD